MTIRAIDNPPNPWQGTAIEWLEPPPPALPRVYEEQARSILSTNDSPDLDFRHSINPYRGCHHGCVYCYARPSHQYLDFGAGTDFERRIVVKTNAPELLEAAFRRPGWRGEWIVLSGNTDCYQPLEARYELTRRLLEVCLRFRNPVAIITKGALIRRDLALLAELHRHAAVFVHVSIPFLDPTVARFMEPWAPAPERRFETLAALHTAGVPCGVSLAPLVPGLNEHEFPEILHRAAAAGASCAFQTLLRLPGPVAELFESRLREALPDRAERVMNGIRAVKGGQLEQPGFGQRFRGEGPRWETLRQLWRLACRRAGLNDGRPPGGFPNPRSFRDPDRPHQAALFPEDGP